MAEKRAEHKALIAAKENRKKRSDLDLDESDRLVHRNAAARGYKRKGFGRNQAYNVANEDAFMPNAQKILNDPDSTPEAKHAALERAMPGRGKGGKGNTRMTYQQYIDGATTAAIRSRIFQDTKMMQSPWIFLERRSRQPQFLERTTEPSQRGCRSKNSFRMHMEPMLTSMVIPAK